MMTKTPRRRFGVILSGLFILAGVAVIGMGVWNLARGLQSKNWPIAEGVIQAARMERHSGKHGSSYLAKLSYTYQVAGNHYTGTRLAFGVASGSPANAQKVLDRFPEGKGISVHYSPNHPQVAVLEPGIQGGTWLCFGGGTIFVLFGCLALQIQASIPEGQRFGTFKKPPILVGIIAIVVGSFFFFMEPSGGISKWVVYVAGGVFVLVGIFIVDYCWEHRCDDE